MRKDEYRIRVLKAVVEEFAGRILDDFPDELDEKPEGALAQANDELMLAVYEATFDKRR